MKFFSIAALAVVQAKQIDIDPEEFANTVMQAIEQVNNMASLQEAKENTLLAAVQEGMEHVDFVSAIDEGLATVEMTQAIDEAMQTVELHSAMDEAMNFASMAGEIGVEDAKQINDFITEMNDHVELMSAIDEAMETASFMTAIDGALE
jgi:hypothetical protein